MGPSARLCGSVSSDNGFCATCGFVRIRRYSAVSLPRHPQRRRPASTDTEGALMTTDSRTTSHPATRQRPRYHSRLWVVMTSGRGVRAKDWAIEGAVAAMAIVVELALFLSGSGSILEIWAITAFFLAWGAVIADSVHATRCGTLVGEIRIAWQPRLVLPAHQSRRAPSNHGLCTDHGIVRVGLDSSIPLSCHPQPRRPPTSGPATLCLRTGAPKGLCLPSSLYNRHKFLYN
jgi:hypothetical protein